MLTLIVEADGEAPRALRLARFPSRIGRQADCDVRLAGWRVARLHAEIHRIERGFKLVDRGSLGGTWVNGERVVEYAPLGDDDEIAIAGYRLRVHPRAEEAAGRPHVPVPVGGMRSSSPGQPANDAVAGVDALAGVEAPGAVKQPDDPGHADHPVHADLEWRRLLHRRLLAAIDLRRQDIRQLSVEQLRQQVEHLLRELLADERALPPRIDRERLIGEVLDEAVGLGPLEPLLRDDTITEIMVNAPDEIYVERDGYLELTPAVFTGEDAVRATIDRIVTPVGRRVDEGAPVVDARLPHGARGNAGNGALAVNCTPFPSDLERRIQRWTF